MGLLEILGGLIIAGVFIIIVFVLVKKSNEETEQMIASLTEEQINKLKSSEVVSLENNNFIFTAIIAKINDKGGNKLSMDLLYCDKVRMGPLYNKIVGADAKILREEKDKYNLREGDFIKICIDFEKFTIKVIFD